MKLEDLTPQVAVDGIRPDAPANRLVLLAADKVR